MQFIIVEWLVWEITKNPLSLGLIGLMEVVPAVSMALFAGHIVDQKEKRNLLIYCIIAFLFVSLGFYIVTSSGAKEILSSQTTLYLIYLLVFIGGFIRAFFGPTIFSLVALIVPKKTYANASKYLEIKFQDSLKSNTTYVFNFGESIVDNNADDIQGRMDMHGNYNLI